jgi:hypothetical protein
VIEIIHRALSLKRHDMIAYLGSFISPSKYDKRNEKIEFNSNKMEDTLQLTRRSMSERGIE